MAHTETIGAGETYTTIQLWEDGRDGILDGIETGECKGEAFSLVDFNGNAADSTNYMHLTSQSGAEHDGRGHEVSGAGNARIEYAGASVVITIQDSFTRVSWMEVEGPGDNDSYCVYVLFQVAGSTLHFHHNLIHNNHANNSGDNDGLMVNDGDVIHRSYRNIVYGFSASGIRCGSQTANSDVYNNTVYENNFGEDNFREGIEAADGDLTVKNNASFENFNADFALTGSTADNNASSDGSGDADLDNLTVANELENPTTTWANCDLRIKQSGPTTIAEAGTDLSGITATHPSIDESADNRGVSVTNWDCGATEYVAAGIGAIMNQLQTTNLGADLYNGTLL